MSSNSKLIFDSYRILTSASPHYQQCWLCDETIFRILNAHYPSLKKAFNFTADVALPTAAVPPPSYRRRCAGALLPPPTRTGHIPAIGGGRGPGGLIVVLQLKPLESP